jgi:hypothetical protein
MFNFPKITREMRLGDYAPEYAGAVFDVWVNPPRKRLTEFYLRFGALNTDRLDEQQSAELNDWLNQWLSEFWSQGLDPVNRLTPADVQLLSEHLMDIDPRAWQWLIENTLSIIALYRDTHRKN